MPDKEKISAKTAKEYAENLFDEFNKTQKINLDFDIEIKKITNSSGGSDA